MRNHRHWGAALFTAICGGLSLMPVQAATPNCTTTTGPQIPGCTFSSVNGRIEPSVSNSPGEPILPYSVQDKAFGFSHAEDEVAWRGKYVSSAHASASPGVLKTSAVISGRHEPDLLDRPRLANTRAQATAWYYDRLSIIVAGASFGQDALIHASLMPLGGYSQVFDNLKGPGDGYPLNPRGIFAFNLGASQFQSASITGSANDLGALNISAQFNSGVIGYSAHASHSIESGGWENIAGDPFGTPLDFVIRFKSGVPFYLQAHANLIVLLEMTAGFPVTVQPLGSISDLHGVFGDSFYWNGLSNAKVNGDIRSFSVSSASGTDWSASMAPVPEPRAYVLLLAGLAIIGLRIRSTGRTHRGWLIG